MTEPTTTIRMNAPRSTGRKARWAAVAGVAALGMALSGGARADEGPAAQCEFRGMIKALHHMALTTALHDGPTTDAKNVGFKFDVKRDAISLVDKASGAAVLKVDCGGASLPDVPSVKGQAHKQVTRQLPGRTVAVTALGAASLDIDAGALFARSFHVLTFDDGSASISFGSDASGQGKAVTMYAVSTNANGDFVEKEHASIGCGCERWVTADGQRGQRPLEPSR